MVAGNSPNGRPKEPRGGALGTGSPEDLLRHLEAHAGDRDTWLRAGVVCLLNVWRETAELRKELQRQGRIMDGYACEVDLDDPSDEEEGGGL